MNYFTSDLHLFHKNNYGGIVNICKRPYHNVDEMTEDFICKNNEVITDSDDIWDLGDVAYRCSAKDVTCALKSMNGRRHIILGNHDKPLRQAYKSGLLSGLLKSGKIEIIGGESAIDDPTFAISKMLTLEGQKIFMSHYAYRTWPGAFRGVIMLHGHSHGNLPELKKVKCFDVGVDVWDYHPVSFNVILKKCQKISEYKGESEFEDGKNQCINEIRKINSMLTGSTTPA